MKLQAGTLWRSLAVLALLGAAAAWLVMNTEWVDVPVARPLATDLQQDGSLMARQTLQRLGLQTRRADDLINLPPPGATLVLSSVHWNLLEGTAARLQAWVRAGGHLVVDGSVLQTIEEEEWFPIERAAPDTGSRRIRHDCRVLKQRPDSKTAWGDTSGFVACLYSGPQQLRDQGQAVWALQSDEHGIEVLRLPLGRGRVTAFSGYFNFEQQALRRLPGANGMPTGVPTLRNFSNRGLIEGDHFALLAALVDAQAGDEVWFVDAIDRPPLLLWLWRHAAPALLLAALALALALWRSGSRFGPLQADPLPGRRSLAAQIQASADFLFRHQPAALHKMALRALDDTAASRVAAWRRLGPDERPAALAQATGLPQTALAAALDSGIPRRGAAAADALALLESARRALHQRAFSSGQPRTKR